MWTYWYIREASTAVFVANMPMCWALMRRLFNLRAFNNTSKERANNPYNARSGANVLYGREMTGSKSGGIRSKDGKGESSWWDREAMARTDSEEFIMNSNQGKAVPLEIWESKEFDVHNDRSSSVTDSQRLQQDVMFHGGTKTKTVVSARRSDSIGSRH